MNIYGGEDNIGIPLEPTQSILEIEKQKNTSENIEVGIF